MNVELAETRGFLASHPPFSSLPPGELDALPSLASERYYRRGSVVMSAGRPPTAMFVVRSGAVEIVDEAGQLVERGGVGNCFGQSSIIEGRSSRFTFTAIEDSLVLRFPPEVVVRLVETYPVVADHFSRGRIPSPSKATSEVLRVRVGDMMSRRRLVSVSPEASVAEAAATMDAAGVSAALVVVDGSVAGILTDRDLRRVVALGQDPARPVSETMTPDPVTISEDAPALDVLLGFLDRGIHHMPVTRDGVGVGMVTSGDLMRLEQSSPLGLASDIARQGDVAGLARLARRLPGIVGSMLERGSSADEVAQIVSATHESIWRRVVTLGEARLGPPPVRYCLVALGSLARRESSLVSDQDHAMILAEPAPDEWFARQAEFVTDSLAECGFPRCAGDVMASNPKWRTPLETWRHQFRSWTAEPEPNAVLAAGIFFDMRPVAGDHHLYEELRRKVLPMTAASTRFLGLLARHACEHDPPIGFFRGFVVERAGEHRDTLDIKAGGISGLVDIVRVHALANGLSQVSTRDRIHALFASGALSEETASNLGAAFDVLSHTRLVHQAAQASRGERPDNRINPGDLFDFDRRALREAFATLSRAQTGLATRFQTQFMR